MRKTLFVLAAVCTGGCSKYYYNPAPQVLPQHVRKIALRDFANHTNKVHIEEKLTMAVHSAFNRDGRFSIVSEDEADGVLIGTLTRYILMPMEQNANNVTTTYKLWVLADITFYDKVHQQTLWTEKNLEAKLTAPAASTGLPGAISEVEAQQKLWDQLAADIAKRTFEGFGTVTGMSEKAVPQSAPGEFNLPPASPPEER